MARCLQVKGERALSREKRLLSGKVLTALSSLLAANDPALMGMPRYFISM